MIGRVDPLRKSVTVIGGGISGMLAAYRCLREGHPVRLIEASDRLGGLIRTKETTYGMAETAAHSLLASPAVERLCAELGVALVPVNPTARARYIARDGRLRRFPLGPLQALAALLRALGPAPRLPADASLADWGRACLGQPALDYLLNPFTLGIHGVPPEELALDAAFPQLRPAPGHSLVAHLRQLRGREKEAKNPRRPRPMKAPRDGMGSLIAALGRNLEANPACRIELNRRVADEAEFSREENLIIATEATAAGRICARRAPQLASLLAKVRYTPMTTVTVFAPRADFAREPRGVGALFPSRERSPVLGILFNSSAFPGRVADSRHLSLTAMIAGADCPDAELAERIQHTLEAPTSFGFRGQPLHLEITRWERAIPRYDSALSAAIHEMGAVTERAPGLAFTGNYLGQLSLRGLIEENT